MDIPMIGRTKSRILNTVFSGDLDAFEAAATGNYDFTSLEDFGDILNHNIHAWFSDEDNLRLWRELQKEMNFKSMEESTMTNVKENPFMNKTVVATGKLDDILLSLQDLFRIAKRLDLTPADTINQFCEVYIGNDSRIPVVRIRPKGSIQRCPFLKDRKCFVHEAKPAICAMFPIGRAVGYSKDPDSEMNTVEVFQKLVSGLLNIFQDSIQSIILYGSVARGTHTAESDVDIAVIVTEYTKTMHDRFHCRLRTRIQ